VPNWHQITDEIVQRLDVDGIEAFNLVRQKYMSDLQTLTGRDTILYAANWSWSNIQATASTSIHPEDAIGLMAVMSGLKSKKLDLILHTPGGYPSGAEAIVNYLRLKFDEFRVIIPHAAMSAGTMISCAADSIMMGKHSFIGPTDPQMPVFHQGMFRTFPAQAILDEFNRARRECKDPASVVVWSSIIEQYPMGLISECENSINLCKTLVREWLQAYMFKGDADADQKSSQISGWLTDNSKLYTHNRYISRAEAEKRGLKIEELEQDQQIQDLVLSVFHATMLQFGQLPDYCKLIENHLGDVFMPPMPL
jgi:hypothetical protein